MRYLVNSRQKGANGERKFAQMMRDFGFKDCRRGQQYCGANGDADIVGLPGLHVECKVYRDRLKGGIYGALDQSKRDVREGEVPVVFHRKDYCEALVTMRLEDWVNFYREWRK